MSAERTGIFLRLELADALRSRWLVFTCAVYMATFGAFVWLGLRESSVLGFTGLSRVVLELSNAIVLALPLLALVATSQSVVRARGSGLFELMLAQPCKRSEWFAGLVGSRLVVLLGPLTLLLAGAAVVGLALDPTDHTLPVVALRGLLVSAALLFAFVGTGVLLSAVARTGERATVYALLVWLAASALHDLALIGVLLRARLSPAIVFTLAAANPVESARIAILSGVDPELSVLGPVGFWLANVLGPARALAAGVLWPMAIGVFTLWLANRILRRADLVG
jgi:ABC-2 type transport system permease protein